MGKVIYRMFDDEKVGTVNEFMQRSGSLWEMHFFDVECAQQCDAELDFASSIFLFGRVDRINAVK